MAKKNVASEEKTPLPSRSLGHPPAGSGGNVDEHVRSDQTRCPRCGRMGCPRTGAYGTLKGLRRYRKCNSPACGHTFSTFQAAVAEGTEPAPERVEPC